MKSLNSAIFTGQIRHRRFQPKQHAFTYPIFMLYLDLDEVDALFSTKWYCSISRFNIVNFKRDDFMSPEEPSLKQAVIHKVADNLSQETANAITSVRGLMHLRYLNIIFNPVVFYYCFDQHDDLVCIVSEITNTPWDERHAYVLPVSELARQYSAEDKRYVEKGKGKHQFEFQKAFHVSPFNPMNMDYRWVFSNPADKLFVQMDNYLDSANSLAPASKNVKHFDATLILNRKDFQANLAKTLIQYPLITVKVITGIYWQALKLKLKGVPFYDHPKTLKR